MTVAPVLLALSLAAAQPALQARVPGGDRAEWVRGEPPVLLTLARRGEGWTGLAARLCGNARLAAELQAANGGLSWPLRDVRVRIPITLLRGERVSAVFKALFPRDRRAPEGWVHVITAPWRGDAESWWEMAEWFSGDGARYPELREANPGLGLFPPRGAKVLIPARLLRPELRTLRPEGEPFAPTPAPTQPPAPAATATPVSPPAAPTPSPGATPAPARRTPMASPSSRPTAGDRPVPPAGEEPVLEYGKDHAVYRLRPGEALYSAVVVRFTGQLLAADVNATAAELARLSGIEDVTAIPVGYPVRIPLELLLPEYLPASDPRRREWEKDREELAAIRRAISASNLDGIHVIIDAGHGGADTGAIVGGVWESTYVYDMASRLRRALQRDSKATVWLTVRDVGQGDTPPERDTLPAGRQQKLLVTPPYDLADASTGVHLRWVLANSILERLRSQKVEPERVAFVSIHADSLHPSVRGLMVYVPSRHLRAARAPDPATVWSCEEARTLKAPRFPDAFNSRAEALSGQLGDALVRSAERFGVAVHPYRPVRSSVLRGGSRWVPAVLRYNRVPTSVLVEISNLANEEDRALLQTARFREKLALALAAGLAEAFSR
ncbi:MAG TPA: N-acetylmuramoyl-L-alanine amidase [Thermoanaerobaculaceae bacterium]|nr:N-acetylmuramoyl-L-alanine amidase [Thermoanaerobaculaceae bacterium]HRS16029.1 N-acetylmuramoyl-L-alanine amidase [Thermoanaerobaculaceae bacterium]